MGWAAIDDQLAGHRKVFALRAGSGDALAALGLWTLCLSWCGSDRYARETGEVPAVIVDTFAAPHDGDELAGALVAAGLWESRSDGYAFHDWSDWNGPDAKSRRIEQRRASDRARQQKRREGLRGVS